ncbi:MAG: glucosaminidase domain-containing protein [Methanobrevibacter sp.]|nr:glucosaminidase domain-containing protein [Methanobrevibacter sp.]
MTSKQYDFIKTMCCNIEEIFPTLSYDVTLFIACQSALETNYGTSDLCRLFKNYFGMRNPMSRPSTSKVWGNCQFEWANFNSCYSSIVDYFLCVAYRKPLAKELENLDLFKYFIKNWYCPEKDYIEKVSNIMSNFKSYKDENRTK